jgi:serine/threonine-protein kinase ULK/ATG1
VIEAGNL